LTSDRSMLVCKGCLTNAPNKLHPGPTERKAVHQQLGWVLANPTERKQQAIHGHCRGSETVPGHRKGRKGNLLLEPNAEWR